MARNVLFLTLITLLCLSFQVSAQRVSGRITGGNGDGLAFATIHQKGTTSGSTSNPDGYFSLMLPAGSHTLVFQFVGYKTQEVAVTVDEDPITLQVKMEPEVTQLQEVVINATDKDPAYAIIQNAIAKRKEHLREVSSYQCQVYVKGLQRLDIVPDKILGVKLNIDTGIVYLSESVSELSFQQPEKVKEKVISSKTSGDNRAFSYNQASDMLINFYQNQLYAEGLSERSFVSPIAQNALFFYNYKLAGVINENDRIINKIQVIPKRSSDPVFNGWIYILEDSWRIHSLELLLTKANQIEFVDSLTINQVFTPVDYQGNEVWMMLSQKFQFQLEAFGVKGGGYFVGVHSQYDLQPAFEKKYFNLERVKVEANSNKKDSLYWQRIRPIPLTQLETLDYRLKDSIQVIKETEHYQDSVDREGNQLTITNVLLTGKTFRKSFKKQSFYIPSMMELLQYNTVEGWVPNLRVVYTQRYEDRRFYRFIPQLRYGFSNRKFNPQLEARYYYNPKRFASGRISFGRSVEQFNQDGPVPPFANAYYTLLKEQNILKIFEKTFFKLGHNIELVNGLRLGSRVEFAERSPLENTTDFVLNDHEERSFTPNKPVNASLEDTDFKTHQAFTIDLTLRWQPGQEYIMRPYRKFLLDTSWPAFNINYRAALPDIFGSDVNFGRLSLGMDQDVKMGLLGKGQYLLEWGHFTHTDSLSFIDYQHFNGNQTFFAGFEMENFYLLDYYLYSTNDTYFQGHYEHHFNGFIFNKIPLMRKLKLQAVAGIHYLHTDTANNYWELGFGVEHIFKILRVDFYTSFLDGKSQDNGFKIGLGF